MPANVAERYPIPAGEAGHEIAVLRSRFLANAAPAASVDGARVFIQVIRDRHPDATHHCWAFLVGPPGSSDRVGMSDDGEPHGTAGRPLLHALSHANVGDIVVVVTRWFGGTKLGTGGLVRAYSDAVRGLLERLPTVERVDWAEVDVMIDYARVEPLRRALGAWEAEVIDERFDEYVTLRVRLPHEQQAAFTIGVANLSNGRARVAPVA